MSSFPDELFAFSFHEPRDVYLHIHTGEYPIRTNAPPWKTFSAWRKLRAPCAMTQTGFTRDGTAGESPSSPLLFSQLHRSRSPRSPHQVQKIHGQLIDTDSNGTFGKIAVSKGTRVPTISKKLQFCNNVTSISIYQETTLRRNTPTKAAERFWRTEKLQVFVPVSRR